MIQIYSPDNTDYEHNGDMTLFPSSAIVHPILNGTWEVTMEHPLDDEGRWKYIVDNAVVKMPSFNGEQLFRITHKEKDDSGISADMQPIFLDAADDCFLLDVRPTDKTGQQALDLMTAPNRKYSAVSNISKASTAYYQNKNLIEAICGNDDNSFLKRWGGEAVYDNYKVIVNKEAGSDKGVEILYGKNIAENGISEEVDMRSVVTRIVPKSYNGYMIEGAEPWVDSPLIEKYPTIKYKVLTFETVKMKVDASEDDEDNGTIICNTQEELEEALIKKCMEQYENGLDKPTVSIGVDMVAIEDTEIYADVKDLVKVSLGDTVHCRNSKLEIVSDARVIELKWDSVNDRISEVTLGDYRFDYISNQANLNNRIESAIRSDGSVVGAQVQGILDAARTQFHALRDVAKKQDVRAMLFEDLDPESPTFGAMCLGTMGFEIASKRTANGTDWDWTTFGTGQGFFADFIVAGTMLADRIKGGTLTLGGQDNGSGIASVLDGEGNEIVRLDRKGVYAAGSYVCEPTKGGLNRRAEINAGTVMFSAKGGSKPIFLEWSSGGIVVRYGGTFEDVTDSKTLMRVFENAVYFDTDKVGPDGDSGKTGKAEFSDGTYLEFKKGFLVGGKSTEGGSF